MNLSATIDLLPEGTGYVHYVYDTVADEHLVNILKYDGGSVHSGRSKVRGEIINHLAPYRDTPEVHELVSWLGR